MTADQLSVTIENLGGAVYTKNIEKAVEASYIVITSQKKVNRPINKINKTLIMAYRLGWPIVSKQLSSVQEIQMPFLLSMNFCST
mgnify:CR=1 FL=1